MSRLLLDTHVWVWWVDRPEKLSRAQRTAIDHVCRSGREPLLLSIISCWEVVLLHARRRIRPSTPLESWLDQSTAVLGLEVLPLTIPVVVTAARLTELHDPADRLIVATAQHHGARLVTSDARIAATRAVSIVG